MLFLAQNQNRTLTSWQHGIAPTKNTSRGLLSSGCKPHNLKLQPKNLNKQPNLHVYPKARIAPTTMTRQASDNPISNGKIRQAVAEIASSVDLEETSFKKMQRLV
jgi:hypothetical protein